MNQYKEWQQHQTNWFIKFPHHVSQFTGWSSVYLALWRRWRPAADLHPAPFWRVCAIAERTHPAPLWWRQKQQPGDRHCGPWFQQWRTQPRQEATQTHVMNSYRGGGGLRCKYWETSSEYLPLGRGVPAGCCRSGWASDRGSLPCWGTAWSSSSSGCDGWEHQTWTPRRLRPRRHTGLQQSDQQLEREGGGGEVKQCVMHVEWKMPDVEVSISNIPDVIAWLEEMQAMVTVWAGILSEKPAPSAACEHIQVWRLLLYKMG